MYKCSNDSDYTSQEIYNILYEYFGPQEWWPADTPFEVMVGAILTQAVNWNNVEKALNNLKDKGLLKLDKINQMGNDQLAELIRPSGYYNMKAKKLKALTSFIQQEYDGNLEKMFNQETSHLRDELLSVYGIGPETADSILLYACEHPEFVVDAYTERIFSRLGLIKSGIEYDNLKEFIVSEIPPDIELYQEYHALLVKLGKNYCQSNNPNCSKCPLG